MNEKKIGISVYPEFFGLAENQRYIKKAADLGYSVMFMSMLHLDSGNVKTFWTTYQKLIGFAKQNGFYVILDIGANTVSAMNDDLKTLRLVQELKVDCLRLDAPLQAKEIADMTYHHLQFDIQLNASNNDHLLENILDYDPVFSRLQGCHNFYPQINTGLDETYFMESSQRFVRHNLKVSAFVGSHVGNRGPQAALVGGLVTLENDRALPIDTQAKHLWLTGVVQDVIIGNEMASDEELASLANARCDKMIIKMKFFPGIAKMEKDIIAYQNHFNRGDVNAAYVRSTMMRVDFKNIDIPERASSTAFNRGDVAIINNNDAHYKGELVIIKQNNFTGFGNKANLVGMISSEKILLNYLKPWRRFVFIEEE